MIKSMTGYGRSEEGGFKVEIRCLNHRFCDIVIKLPPYLASLEESIRKSAQDQLQRGRIEISITQQNKGSGSRRQVFEVNEKLANDYLKVLKRMSKSLGIPFSIGIEFLAKTPGIVQFREPQIDINSVSPIIHKIVVKALCDVKIKRLREGKHIGADINKRLRKVAIAVHNIVIRGPIVVERYKHTLEKRLKNILNKSPLDKDQTLNEVAIFAERSDVTEEIVRLKSHLKQFRLSLKKNTTIGQELNFILQEMTREVNTIGSKGNDYRITKSVIIVKGELEKMRQQVQNIV